MNRKENSASPGDSGGADLEARITPGKRILIRTSRGHSVSRPVYAVNWFNTRSSFVYNLYNLLAYRSVRKIDGRPFFKGRVTDVLHGDKRDRRELLLIVRYPKMERFVAMLEDRYFQAVSVLRILAVEAFTFCFTQRRAAVPVKAEAAAAASDESNDLSDAYAVHHYRGADINEIIVSELNGSGVSVFFAGRTTACLLSADNSRPERETSAVPHLMDGVLLLRAGTRVELTQLLTSPSYTAWIDKTDSSFIALLNRLF